MAMISPSRSVPRTALAMALALAGCTGSIEGGKGGTSPPTTKPPGNGGGASGGGPMTPPVELPPMGSHPLEPKRDTAACKAINPGPAPVRRLTRAEYDNTVRDLIGEDKQLAKGFPPEELQHSFDNSAELRSVSDVLAENYVSAAKEIGKTVVGKMGSFLTCDPAKDGEPACLDKFLDGFGKRAWRRPLQTSEREDLKKVFTAGRTATFADGLEAVVRVLLLSPQFMYRLEKGVPVPGAEHQRLDHWEMASRLSYLLWGTMPDAPLFSAAEAGKLGTRDEVGAQAQRMLDDPRATAMVTNFAGQWLHLRELADADKDPTIYPAWKEELLPLFRQETERFVELVWKGDGKLDTLLSAPYTAVNGALAAFYGIKGVTGDDFRKVDVDPTQRAGLLTQASILAEKSGPDQSSPILRGVFVREQMFCQPLPSPPPSVEAKPPELNANQTTKERFAAHRSDPSCAGCHNLIDAVGFGLENYDATGAYRAKENGKPVDATGELVGTDVDGKFDGAIELSKRLVQSKAVESCMAQHWFNFAFGREKSAVDSCTEETLGLAFAKAGGDLRQLMLATVQSDAFFFKGGRP
jgi:hypothetical protein